MSLLHFDTCQYSTLAPDVGWDTGSAVGTYTATGGPFNDRYYSNTNLTKTLGVNAVTLTYGGWFRTTAGGAVNIARFLDGASVQCSLLQEVTTNKLKVLNGTAGTQLGISAAGLTPNVWVFVEWEVTFGNTGSTKVWVDGTLVINVSSVDTTTTANNYGNVITLPAGLNGAHFGSLYVIDTAGSLNNARLGPVKGYLLSPTADGTYTAWTPNTGTRWQAVDETPAPNDDTDYISNNTAGNKNSVALANTPAGLGTIHGVAHYTRMRRDDAGPHTGRAGLRVNGTDYPAATETLAASYVGYSYMRETSPDTSAAWTSSELDGTEHYVETVT
jgi:hypothetical protein